MNKLEIRGSDPRLGVGLGPGRRTLVAMERWEALDVVSFAVTADVTVATSPASCPLCAGCGRTRSTAARALQKPSRSQKSPASSLLSRVRPG